MGGSFSRPQSRLKSRTWRPKKNNCSKHSWIKLFLVGHLQLRSKAEILRCTCKHEPKSCRSTKLPYWKLKISDCNIIQQVCNTDRIFNILTRRLHSFTNCRTATFWLIISYWEVNCGLHLQGDCKDTIALKEYVSRAITFYIFFIVKLLAWGVRP